MFICKRPLFSLSYLSVHKCSAHSQGPGTFAPGKAETHTAGGSSSPSDGGAHFGLPLRMFQNHINMIEVLLFGGFDCCFIHFSLPLNKFKFEWLLPEILKLFLD